MRYAKRFLISFIAGAGSAIGAFVGKECMTMAKTEYKRKVNKKKTESVKETTSKKGEES